MRFISSIFAGAALIASVFALEINEAPSNAQVGETYTIRYSPADDTPTTFILRVGDAGNLDTVTTLTTTATGGTFQWTVDRNLPNDNTYALEIRQAGAQPNYLGPFTISGSTASSRVESSEEPSTTSAPATETSSSAEETATLTTTVSGNSTIVLPTGSASGSGSARLPSRTSGSGSSPTTSGPGAPENTDNAAGSLRPAGLVVGAVAALAYLY